MNYFLWLILISILILNSYLATSESFKSKRKSKPKTTKKKKVTKAVKKTTTKAAGNVLDNSVTSLPLFSTSQFGYYPKVCDSIQTYMPNLDEFNYVKCIGLMNDEYKDQFDSKKIPFYHIHKTFTSIQDIIKTAHLELEKIYNKHKKTGPCYILVSKTSNSKIDTFILFPSIAKNLSLIKIRFNLAKCYRWIYLNIYHPYNNSNRKDCGLFTKSSDNTKIYPSSKTYKSLEKNHIFEKPNRSGYLFNIPFSHCSNSPVTVKYDANYKEGYYYYGCQGRYVYYYKNCGCSTGCNEKPNLDYEKERTTPAQKKHFVVYTPNVNHPLFKSYDSEIGKANRSYFIEGQRITKKEHTFIVSENSRFIAGLNNIGFYIKDTLLNSYTYIKKYKLSDDAEVIFSGDTMSLLNLGVVRWNKNLVPQSVDSTSPYVVQLTDNGNFSIWDIKGNQLFI